MQKLQTREELLMHFDRVANNEEKNIGLAKKITNINKEQSTKTIFLSNKEHRNKYLYAF